jgi:hypothetical protein
MRMFCLARFCLRGVSVALGGVVLEPVLAHQSLLWLSLLLSWLNPSFSCLLSGCSLESVGILSRPIVGCDDSCDLVSWFFS